MKTTFRSTLALLLCVALIACLIPAAFAEEDPIVIPDSIAFYEPDVETVMEEVSLDTSKITEQIEEESFNAPEAPAAGSFVIPDSTTHIEEEAFAGCVGMTSVKIPAGVKSIGDGAFSGCDNLAEVRYDGSGEQWDQLLLSTGVDNGPLLNARIRFPSDLWIPVTEAYFPDAIFRGFVSYYFDTDHNGYLSAGERDRAATINCSGTAENPGGIKSLEGIRWFRYLRGLYCSNNALTELDVSGNVYLEVLYCSNNPLSGLDLSHNTLLERLYCSSTGLTSLDLSKNSALKIVYAHYNNLTALDVSKNTNLAELYMAYNPLTALNLSYNTKLKNLEVLGNRLTRLDLRSNTVLETLYCGRNLLRSLLVSSPVLKTLDCHVNDLTSLNISKTTGLAQLNCSYNQLSSLDISKCSKLVQVTQTVAKRVRDGIVYYYVDDNSPYLIYDDAGGSNTAGIPITKDNFPDPTFRAGVSEYYDKNHDGYLSYSEIRLVDHIDCRNLGITTLKGIEYFTFLKILRCLGNPLYSLDVSSLTNLQELVCCNTNISTLDIRNNIYLRALVNNVAPTYPGNHVLYEDSPYKLEFTYGVRLYA